MAECWKSLLPEKYAHLTKCHHVIKQYPSKGKNADIVICTDEGYVLEFLRLRIVGCCKIPVADPKAITHFTSFDYSSSHFYIIESNEDVIILERKKELQVIKQYGNVKRSKISDFSNTGYPQLGIWTGKSKSIESPDIIVNLHEGDSSTSEDHSISDILNEKCEELRMAVKDHEHKLKLKKQLRMYNCEVVDHAKKVPSTSGLELIQLVGEDQREIDPKEHLQQEFSLQVSETWQRIHNSKWVIGITICNTGQRNLEDLHLILKSNDEEKLSYVSKMVMYCEDEVPLSCKRKKFDKEFTEGAAAWKSIHILKSKRKAIVIGILNIPKFISTSVVNVSALITYRFVGESSIGHRVPVSPFQYSVEDFCKRIGSAFSVNCEISEADFLSVLMSSVTVTVPVTYKVNVEPSLRKILVEELKFVEFAQLGCLFHKGTCHVELDGIMLHVDQVDPLNYQVSISARDMQQIYMLVHCMYNVLSAPLMLVFPPQVPETSLLEGVSHQLDQELELVLNQLKCWAVNKPTKLTSLKSDVQVPYAEYLKFRAQLLELERKTDFSALSDS